MKHLISFLLICFATTCGFCQENRKIDSIIYRSQGIDMIATIKLSDESMWTWVPDPCSVNLLRTWKAGDEIIIELGNHPGFILHNISKPRYQPIVSLCFQSYNLFPSITKLALDGTFIELSDESSWQLLYEFNLRTLKYWSEGDHIIVTKGIRDNYELINLDISCNNRLCIERSIQVEKRSP